MTMTWLHGSPHKLAVGDVLRPGIADANFKESDTAIVSVTTEADYARLWARKAAKALNLSTIYVYTVEPETDPEIWRQGMKNFGKDIAVFEGRTPSARIIDITVIDLPVLMA